MFGIFTWEGILSLIVIFAKLITTVAYGVKNTFVIRLLVLPSSVCRLIYNIFANSQAGALNEAFAIVSVIVGLLRLDIIPFIKEKRLSKKENAQ